MQLGARGDFPESFAKVGRLFAGVASHILRRLGQIPFQDGLDSRAAYLVEFAGLHGSVERHYRYGRKGVGPVLSLFVLFLVLIVGFS